MKQFLFLRWCFIVAAILIATQMLAQHSVTALAIGHVTGGMKKCSNPTCKDNTKNWLPYSDIKKSGHWEVLASTKGGVGSLAAIDVSNQACVGAAMTRGMLALAGPDGVEGIDAYGVYLRMMRGLQDNKITKYHPGTRKNDCDYDGGGTHGDVHNYKEVKDEVAGGLYKKGLIRTEIETTVFTPSTSEHPRDVIERIKKALAAGCVVEVDIDNFDGSGHFANVVEVTKSGDDLGITIADDPKQADGKAEVGIKNTYFFPEDGKCYYWSRANKGKKTVPPINRRIRGVMIQKKKDNSYNVILED